MMVDMCTIYVVQLSYDGWKVVMHCTICVAHVVAGEYAT